MRWPFATRRERLRRQAADWVARLNGPHDEADRAEFELWYGSNPDHAEAFDRLSNLFNAAGQARRPEAAGVAPPPAGPVRPRSRPFGYAFAAAAAGAALLAFFILSARTASPLPEVQRQFAAFSAEGEGRRIALADGSEVLLSANSAVDVALGGEERRLRLTRGEARFSVAGEARPFIVAADGTEVFARGTQFIVRVGSGRTTITLIEGSVDVSYAPNRAGERRLTRLRPGEQLVVEAATPTVPSDAATARATSRQPPPLSLPAMFEFDETPLREAVVQVNRSGSPPIRIADPALASLRISGAFRSGDTAGFARSIAAAFNLELERGRDGSLRLRARAQPSQKD